ncbi:hypothetical protein ADK86_38975 [Streptomyces sp. NRRL F-5755]|nr:hypothetical protein ADK86_38975 [Streptomyces sp. NRRL F-5755]
MSLLDQYGDDDDHALGDLLDGGLQVGEGGQTDGIDGRFSSPRTKLWSGHRPAAYGRPGTMAR